MEFFKALIPGVLLTLVICGILGVNHYSGGFLHISHEHVRGISFYWSWVMFGGSTLLAFAIFTMTPK